MVYYEDTKKLIESAEKQGLKKTKDNILYVSTGKFTGRSPKDRYFVDGDYSNEVIDFSKNINQKISVETYNILRDKLNTHLKDNTFESRRVIGYSSKHMATFRLKSTMSWGVLFFNNMTIDPKTFAKNYSDSFTEWEILHAPDFEIDERPEDLKNDNFVVISFEDRKIIIGGTAYTGEIKKSMFTVMNTLLVDRDVLPMHCSANSNTKKGFGVNIFFGLSGTGKTTLSSDPLKFFIGDDEHGWDGDNIFNFEGGCYAKLIDLDKDKEPIIWNAIHSDNEVNSALLENVIVNEDGDVDYTDSTITENIRVSYPLSQIDDEVKVSMTGRGDKVENIFFLSFDAFGVLPPISLLTNEQAVKYFELGYTSKVAGTEVGVNEPTKVFSACFGEPFLPRKIKDYSGMFMDKLNNNPNVKVWLVNTGFNNELKRFSLSLTRGVINGVIDKDYKKEYINYNNLRVPKVIGDYDMDEVFKAPSENKQKEFFNMINETSH